MKGKQGVLFSEENREIEVYTDGCSLGNPGPGGWACVIKTPKKEVVLSEGTPLTTNNKMELQAVISALSYFKTPQKLKVYTDSEYVLKGITEWLPKWKAKGFRTSSGKPVKNKELWLELEKLVNFHKVTFEKVKAHSNHYYNEMADRIAKESARRWKNS